VESVPPVCRCPDSSTDVIVPPCTCALTGFEGSIPVAPFAGTMLTVGSAAVALCRVQAATPVAIPPTAAAAAPPTRSTARREDPAQVLPTLAGARETG